MKRSRYYIPQPLLCQKCLVDEVEQVLHTSAVIVSEMSCWWIGAGITYISRYCVGNVLSVKWCKYYTHQPLLCQKCLVDEVEQVFHASAVTVSEMLTKWCRYFMHQLLLCQKCWQSGAGITCISHYCGRNVLSTKWHRYYMHQLFFFRWIQVSELNYAWKVIVTKITRKTVWVHQLNICLWAD